MIFFLSGWEVAAHLCFLELPPVCSLEYGWCLQQEVKLSHARTVLTSHMIFFFSHGERTVVFKVFGFFLRNSFSYEHYLEFSKLSQDRVIGTKDQVAHVRNIVARLCEGKSENKTSCSSLF